MKIELKNMSRKELEKLKGDVEKALTKIGNQDRKLAIDAAQKAAAAHGFNLADLTGAPAPKKRGPKPKTGPKVKSAPKYRNPADATQTWTGKGRQPEWFKSAVASGKTPESMGA